MSQFNHKTAIISGGAEGIGLSIAQAMGQQGMNVVIADIDAAQLTLAEAQLKNAGVSVLALEMDVTNLTQWQHVAQQAMAQFGHIHMLVNNAGVASEPGPIEKTNHEDWRWVIDVNLIGVLNGMQAIVPHIKSHGDGGWVINVASMAGMSGIPYAGAYTATKVAVVGMSEAWQVELASHNIDVSVLCPAFVKTRIHLSHRNRQEQHKRRMVDGDASAKKAGLSSGNAAQKLVENGIPAELVGQRVVEAINAGEFYIFTHPGHRSNMQARFNAIDQAFKRAAASPLLVDVEDDGSLNFD